MAVAEKVIKAIGIELAGHDLCEKRGDLRLLSVLFIKVLVEKDLHAIWKARIDSFQDAVHFGSFPSDNLKRSILVLVAGDLLEGVGERTVPNVVQECRRQYDDALIVGHALRAELGNSVENATRHMHHADRVGESAVVGTWEYEFAEPELLDSTQPLEFLCVDQCE
jgi:hypothetical protein